MFDDLKKIIKILLTNTSSKVIFRPHPINRETHLTLEIEESFKNDDNFKLDISNDYFDTYLNSMCLITDISGTAYTYAFLTKKPVIFFSKSEELVAEFGFNERSYFKNRDKVGIIVKNLDEVQKAINNIKYIEKEIRISNSRLEKEEIYYLGNSKNRMKELISEILIENNNNCGRKEIEIIR
jgi:CDP-glycerol glycerophosphotransferase (TagB/SpsB family)